MLKHAVKDCPHSTFLVCVPGARSRVNDYLKLVASRLKLGFKTAALFLREVTDSAMFRPQTANREGIFALRLLSLPKPRSWARVLGSSGLHRDEYRRQSETQGVEAEAQHLLRCSCIVGFQYSMCTQSAKSACTSVP